MALLPALLLRVVQTCGSAAIRRLPGFGKVDGINRAQNSAAAKTHVCKHMSTENAVGEVR